MMKAVQLPEVGSRISDGKRFAGREPLAEIVKSVKEPALQYVFNCISRKRGTELHYRFQNAKEQLERDFGAMIDIVQAPSGGLRVAAKFEFLTTDRTIDENLDMLVRLAGFFLTLRSRPMMELPPDQRYEQTGRFIETCLALATNGMSGTWIKRDPVYELRMERVYVIQERDYASAELHKAAGSAEALYSLLDSKLKLPKVHQDLPSNVVPISSRSPPKAEQKSGVFEAPSATEAKVS
jgi:hypothetical protein